VKIAVVFALPAEFSPWRARHAFRRTNASGREFYDGQIGPTSLRVAFSGVGAPEMRALADTAFDAPAGLVISAGIAGGLKPQYRRSDILVASRLRTTAVDRTLVLDDRLVSLASRCGATIVDSFVTVDRMILRAQEKEVLGRDADAADMESFAVISEAGTRGIAGVAIRVVGDTADEDLPLDFTRALRADHMISVSRVLAEVVLQPGRWPLLLRSGVSYRRALGELARFLDRFIRALEQERVRANDAVERKGREGR